MDIILHFMPTARGKDSEEKVVGSIWSCDMIQKCAVPETGHRILVVNNNFDEKTQKNVQNLKYKKFSVLSFFLVLWTPRQNLFILTFITIFILRFSISNLKSNFSRK